ncbi:unnamed protein product [Sphacelaria rigidula]
MPRYYCDYCGTYLTHDSSAGRRQHNRGWKHTDNVKLHYKQFVDDFLKKQSEKSGAASGSMLGPRPGMNPPPRPGMSFSGSGSLGGVVMNNSLMPGQPGPGYMPGPGMVPRGYVGGGPPMGHPGMGMAPRGYAGAGGPPRFNGHGPGFNGPGPRGPPGPTSGGPPLNGNGAGPGAGPPDGVRPLK